MVFTSKNSGLQDGITNKFNVIGSLIVVLPILILAYIIRTNEILLDYTQLTLLAVVLLLILTGLSILRYVFDSLRLMINFLKRIYRGDALSPSIEKEVSNLSKLSALLANLMDQFEKSAEELNQRVIELNAIREMTETAKKTIDVEALLKSLLDKAAQVTKGRNGSVILVDDSIPEGLRFVAAKREAAMDDEQPPGRDYSVIRRVISDGRPLLVQDIEKDPRTGKINDPRYGAPSFLSMPIYAHEQVVAVISLADKETGDHFSQNDERILSIMLGEIGFALENSVLHLKLTEQLAQISAQNARLERETRERAKIAEDLNKANAQLQETNRKLTQAYEWMRNSRDELKMQFLQEDIGLLVDRDGVIRSITERALEWTGKTRPELIGTSFIAFVDEQCREDFKNELRQVWMGIARTVTVAMSAPHHKTFEVTLTRFTAQSDREILVTLRDAGAEGTPPGTGRPGA